MSRKWEMTLFVDNIIGCSENPKASKNGLLELANEFDKLLAARSICKKKLYFYVKSTNN